MPLFPVLIPFRRPAVRPAPTTRPRAVARSVVPARPEARVPARPAIAAPPVVVGSVAVKTRTRVVTVVGEELAEELADRLEHATGAGGLELTVGQYAHVLHALLPEIYATALPPVPATPTAAAPGTPDRVAAYERRAASGGPLHVRGDAQPDLLGRKNLLVAGRLNQSRLSVIGWEDDATGDGN